MLRDGFATTDPSLADVYHTMLKPSPTDALAMIDAASPSQIVWSPSLSGATGAAKIVKVTGVLSKLEQDEPTDCA